MLKYAKIVIAVFLVPFLLMAADAKKDPKKENKQEAGKAATAQSNETVTVGKVDKKDIKSSTKVMIYVRTNDGKTVELPFDKTFVKDGKKMKSVN